MTQASREALELAARRLLAALDRQHGGSAQFSQNVIEAREALRRLVPPDLDERDRAAA